MKHHPLWLALFASGFVVTPAYADHVDNIVVTAIGNKPEDQSPVPVTVVSDAELQRNAAGTIGATLNSSPGVTSASFGPGVGQPVIRGQNGPRVMTLINGTASADASGVSADHAVAVEPMLADSIEVLRGPATLLYGGGAIGGVVNIVDSRIPQKLSERVHGALELRHDSVDDGDTSVVKLDGSAGQLAYHLDGVYREWNNIDIPGLAFNRDAMSTQYSSDKYIANTDGRNHTLTGGLSWIADDGYLGFSASDMKNNYGIPLDAEAQGDIASGVHIDMQQKRYDVAGEKRDISDAIDALRWHLTYSDYQHQEIGNAGDIGTTFKNKTWENRFELKHAPLLGWDGIVGMQLKRSDFAAIGAESFIPESIGKSGGLFALESYQLDAITYQLGARYDRDSVDPNNGTGTGALSAKSFNNVGVSASALWMIDERWNIGAALSRSQRAPTVEELFSNVTNNAGSYIAHDATHVIEVGNPDLKQETSRNLDLTLHYKGDFAHGYVTAFHNDFHDFIALTDTGFEQSGTPIMDYSQQDARFNGVEFELNVPIAMLLSGASASGKWSVDFYGDHTRGEFKDGGAVPRLPPLRIGTRLNYAVGPLSAYAGVLHAARQNRTGAFETETDGYNRVDAGVSYQLKASKDLGALLFVRATNLTNQTIRNSVSLLKDVAPEPGRSIETGVRFSF
ncbi:MAG TPA: TonB-dependent receptor [Spongiibacteraceae bacterium]|nr:TonB-dependent receptor [Spongiibacteraceae bacterium]